MLEKKILVYSFYRFKTLQQLSSFKNYLVKISKDKLILGTIIIANEGINGTISGSEEDLENFVLRLKQFIKIRNLSLKKSENQFIPFYRLKIKIKKGIVTLGNRTITPSKFTGKHIKPEDWDKIINDSKYLVIDTRNDYEVTIGTFKNSVNPKTKSFRNFPKYI